jgi:hypothetical protein
MRTIDSGVYGLRELSLYRILEENFCPAKEIEKNSQLKKILENEKTSKTYDDTVSVPNTVPVPNIFRFQLNPNNFEVGLAACFSACLTAKVKFLVQFQACICPVATTNHHQHLP